MPFLSAESFLRELDELSPLDLSSPYHYIHSSFFVYHCDNNYVYIHVNKFGDRNRTINGPYKFPQTSAMESFRNLYKNDVDFAALALQSRDFAK